MNEKRTFTLQLKEEYFDLDDGGTKREFVAVELTGARRDTYMNDVIRRTKVGASGKPEVKDFKGAHSKLIALSCYELVDGERIQCKEEDVQKWPASAQDSIFEMCQELSGIGKEDDEDPLSS